ncbi:5-azacytidine-induced protein 2 isoform X1 [Oryzias latipes]|uniref:5-azacytidine-induced protein 2 isoform X1 n=1 Tax=Oryzias latipes TaxID=8090 RepID=UPI0005CC213A|nr:5-azacytidine-induced protein 2 isoform X1 [Oryzias latipes]
MEPLAVDDDICILKHETAYTAAVESPVSVCAGDESVASHFALVTAYEDIKKRLRDTERENALLRKRVKQLEDKLFRPETPSEGPQYVNKAFSAYRGIYIEKEDLQMELNKLKKEKSDSERFLTEQLQAKELELLQLRTEMETSQGTVMKSLNSPQDFWQVEMVNTEMQIHKLQEELERVTLENSRLLEKSTEETHGMNGPDLEQICDATYNASKETSVQQTYKDLCSEVTHLHSELKRQTGLIRKLKPLLNEARQAASTVPVQCLDDVEKNNNLPAPQPPNAPALPSCAGRPFPPFSGPPGRLLPDGLREDCWYNGPWPSQSCSAQTLLGGEGGSVVLPPPPLNQASLDDSSHSFPSPPKPSDAMFWEGHSAASNSSSSMGNCSPKSPPNTEWVKPF